MVNLLPFIVAALAFGTNVPTSVRYYTQDVATIRHGTNLVWSRSSDVTDCTAWWTLDENTGTNVTDAIGGYAGYIFPGVGAKWTNGIAGSAYFFAGNSGINLASNTPIPTTTLTISAWVYSDTPTFNGTIFGRWYSGTDARNTFVMYQGQDAANAKIIFRLRQSNGTQVDLLATNNIAGGEWTHLAVVCDGTNAIYYHNGVFGKSVTYNGTFASATAQWPTIGKLNDFAFTYPYKGRIDDVRMWTRALSATEIMRVKQAKVP